MHGDGKVTRHTAIVSMAMQRDPQLMLRVLHELARSGDEQFPDLFQQESIRDNEHVQAILRASPAILDRHVHGTGAITDATATISGTMPWVSVPAASVSLSLQRGFFPRLYAPNALYLLVAGEVERALLRKIQAGPGADLARLDAELHRTGDYIVMVEDMWRLRFPRLGFKAGPVPPQDLLVSVSPYDAMVVIHPSAPSSWCWPGVLVHALARLLLQLHYPKLHERFKEQLATLTVRATLGDALATPGRCHGIMEAHPVDHAQYQVSTIARDLDTCGDFNHGFLHMFPDQNVDEYYSHDMIAAMVLFLLDDHGGPMDERDLFARVSASSAGYKPFANSYLSFLSVLPALEKAGVLVKEGKTLFPASMST